jgi:hypothetical protein
MNRKDFFKKYPPHDGWMYQTGFDGTTEEESFQKLKEFLYSEGFADIPLPPTARRLWWDYLKPDENGNTGVFVWHPIKIHQSPYQIHGLHLSVFNEDLPNHIELWEGRAGEE